MKRTIAVGLGILMIGMLSGSAWCEEDPGSALDKADKMHTHASSDVIFSQDETKALYYQNVVIIDLLRQIRDLLDARLKPASSK